jgi:anti-sigma-K factor RskA
MTGKASHMSVIMRGVAAEHIATGMAVMLDADLSMVRRALPGGILIGTAVEDLIAGAIVVWDPENGRVTTQKHPAPSR